MRIGVKLTDISDEWAIVDFVLDTGASVTCLHPSDAIQEVGIDPVVLTDPTRWANVTAFGGIGGATSYFTTPAEYALVHSDGQITLIDGTINVAQWTPANQSLPSVLGWDILEHFSLFVDPSSGRLELTPLQNP